MIVTPGWRLTTLLCRVAAGVPLTDTQRIGLCLLGLTKDALPSRMPTLTVLGLAVAAELANGANVLLPRHIAGDGEDAWPTAVRA